MALNTKNPSPYPYYFIFIITGDTGRGVQDWLKMILNEDFKFPHLKVIFPTAPLRYLNANKLFEYST